MLQHVLTQGGIPARQVAAPDSTFKALLNETRAQLSTASFQIVLESCLDRATEILFNGLEKNVFRETNVGGWEETSSTAISLGQETRVRLAGMLPGLARWSQLALEGLPNELVDVSALSQPRRTAFTSCSAGEVLSEANNTYFPGTCRAERSVCAFRHYLHQL